MFFNQDVGIHQFYQDELYINIATLSMFTFHSFCDQIMDYEMIK